MKLLALTINGTPIETPGSVSNLPTTITPIVQFATTLAIVIAAVLALLFLLWGGIQWITSEGDKTKVQAARSKIMFSIIGLVLILLSFFIISTIGTVFNIPLLTPSIP